MILSGKDRDVGVELVKTLQNTKYSIDEKLEQSFINFFSRRPPTLSEIDADEKDDKDDKDDKLKENDNGNLNISCNEDDENLNQVQTMGSDKSTVKTLGKESDSDYSDEWDECDDERPPALSCDLKEEVEFHSGRIRRKAVLSNSQDHDSLEVIYACQFSISIPFQYCQSLLILAW